MQNEVLIFKSFRLKQSMAILLEMYMLMPFKLSITEMICSD